MNEDLTLDNIDIPSERGLIAACLQHGNEVFIDTSDIVTDDTLTQECNLCAWKVIEHINKTHPDINKIDKALFISAANAVGLDKFFAQREEMKYINSLYNFEIEKNTARKLASKLAKLEIARIFRQNSLKTEDNLRKITGDEKISDIMAIVENPIFDLSQRIKGFDKLHKTPQPIFKNGLRKYIEEKRLNPVQQVGFPSGFPIWDRLIGGGLRSPSVNVIVARQKCGKSSIGSNTAYHVANFGIPILMLDTEMGEDEHFPRMTAMLSGVRISEIETGQFARDSAKDRLVGQAVDTLEKIPYDYINIAGQPFEETLTEKE